MKLELNQQWFENNISCDAMPDGACNPEVLINDLTIKKLEEDKQALIDVVIWYRDEYSKGAKTYYDGLIKQIRNVKTQTQLSTFEQAIDNWLG